MGKRVSYFIFRCFVGFFRILPFWFLYRFSDFIFFILYYIVGYRKSVVTKNMNKCFPEKNKNEIWVLRRKFYSILSDLFLETIKGFTMSKDELLKRFKANDCEIANKYFEQGRDVIFVLGHFANWEWAVATLVEEYKHQPAVLYKPMSNQFIDNYFIKVRTRFGLEVVSIRQTNQYFMKEKPKPVGYYMIADQYSPSKERQKEVTFFSSKTPFLNGPEKYAVQLNIPVIYIEIQRVKRGYYSLRLIEIASDPKNLADGEVTQKYAELLEKSITKQPENWVWSHKRWKRELYSFE
jgi:KDO2-lipid IV(A) lauroyltransferase